MHLQDWMQTGGFQYVILPGLIFLLRIGDVTLGTLRILYVSRGMKTLSMVFAFFEVLIWLFAVGQILSNLTHAANYIAFAAGYAAGNYAGIWVEERINLGYLLLRVFVRQGSEALAATLRAAGFGVTRVSACGTEGPAEVLLTVIRRRDCVAALNLIRQQAPQAFYTTEEVKSVSQVPFPTTEVRPARLTGRSRILFRRILAPR